jgi:hypothetical protein
MNEFSQVLFVNDIMFNHLIIRPKGHKSYDVQLENAWGGRGKLIGRFETRKEAIEARNKYYSNNK